MTRILCTTAPWAYGSTTQLITIARHLQGAAELSYLGSGISLEAARRFNFDEFIQVDVLSRTFRDTARPIMQHADLVLSVMNFHAPDPAHDAGTPSILVDGLGWMWDKPRAPAAVTLYVVEEFPGLKANLDPWRNTLPPFEIVGPVVEDRWSHTQVRRDQLIVNFSGLQQYLMPKVTEHAYGDGVWSAVADALSAYNGNILVAGGQALISRLQAMVTPSLAGRVRFESLSHEAFLKELDGSSAMLSAAGLRAIYEAFTYGVPTAFLPPQNMSQELTIALLRSANAAPFGMSWGDLYGLQNLAGMDQDVVVPLVNDCIERFANDRAAQEKVTTLLVDFLRAPADACMGQRTFIEALPKDGAKTVAERALTLARE